MKRFRVFAAFLALLVAASTALSGVIPMTVRADAYGDFDLNRVVTLGADLTEEQKASILKFFGVSEDEVTIITITNQDERDHLGHLLPMEQIGTRTFSCAYVCPTFSNGIQVKTANMNYVTGNMIASTLSTSGVVNCDVLAAAPFEVSGTGALTGAMMAYESAVGEELDPAKKELANEELVTTNDLAQEIGQDEATLVVNDIKLLSIRDGAGEEEVEAIVDGVLADLGEAAKNGGGSSGDFEVSGDLRERLIEFAKKVAAMKYDYDDVGVTLQRVAQNLTETTGIEDPIMDTFEDRVSSKVSDDSILQDTDESALGLDSSQTSSTFQDPGEAEEVTYEEEISGDGIVLVEEGVIDADSWVENTSVLRVRGRNGYALMDAQGSELTEDKYTNLYGECGYISAVVPNDSVNALGLLNAAGDEIVPFEYGVLKVPNQYWAVALKLKETSDDEDYDAKDFDGNYYEITSADIYFIEDEQAKRVAELSRGEFADYYAYGKCINIRNRETGKVNCYDGNFEVVQEDLKSEYTDPDSEYSGLITTYRANNQYGLMGPDDSVILKPSYYDITLDYDRDYIKVSTGSAEGLIDWDGNLMIPAEYESILNSYYGTQSGHRKSSWSYSGNGYVTAVRDGEYVFLDVNGEVLWETGVNKVTDGNVEHCAASVMIQGNDGDVRILAADGTETVLSGYTKVIPMYYGQGMLYRVQDDNYAYGLVDWHGNVLLDTAYDKVALSADGTKLLVYEYSTGCHIYGVTFDGPVYVPKEKEEQEETAAAVHNDFTVAGDGYVSLEEYGKLDGDYRWVPSTNLLWDGETVIDVDGRKLAKVDYDYLDGYKNAYIQAGYSGGDDGYDKFGLLNHDAEKIIDAEYERIDITSPYWAVAYRLEETEEDDGDFKNYSTDKYLVITEVDIYRLDDGSARLAAMLDRDAFLEYSTGSDYINIKDRSGVIVTYDADLKKQEGPSSVYRTPEWSKDVEQFVTYRDNGLYGIMDTDGNIIAKAEYTEVSIYPESGCAVVAYDEKKGVVDLEGNLLVPLQYDRIMSYSGVPVRDADQGRSGIIAQGYVAVRNGDDYGFCSINGEETVAPSVPADSAYIYGAAMIYKDADGVQHILSADGVDTSGEGWSYVSGMDYCYGMLYRCTDAKTYDYIVADWHGQELLPPVDGTVSVSADGEYLLCSSYDEGTTLYRIVYGGEESAQEEELQDEETDAPVDEEEPSDEPREDGSAADIRALVEEAKELVSGNMRGNRDKIVELLTSAGEAADEANLSDVSDSLDLALSLVKRGSSRSTILEILDTVLESLL